MAGWLPSGWDADAYEDELREEGQSFVNKTSGEDIYLESVADNILARGRRGTTKHSELRDYLSKSQLALRQSREVYPSQGFPEENIYKGLYRRAYNPTSRGTHSSNSVPGFDEGNEETHGH